MDITIIDEVPGNTAPVGVVKFASPQISVRDLIRSRVELEIERNRDQIASEAQVAARNVESRHIETLLNCGKGHSGLGRYFLNPDHDTSDCSKAEQLIADAEEGFVRGRYFLLLPGRQPQSLDEVIDLAQTTEATFLLLTPLRGG